MLDDKNLAILESLKKSVVKEQTPPLVEDEEVCHAYPIDGKAYPTIPVKVTSFAQ